MIEILLQIFIFCLGAAVGSFLNVCIFRMPRKQSIISPASHCPHCQKSIAWYDNIPMLSYILLKGKCRHCAGKISLRYFLVELLTAGLFLLLFYHFGLTLFFWVYAVLAASLVVVSFIDIDIREIPDEISLCGIVIGFLLSLIFPQLQGQLTRSRALWASGLGFLVGGGSIYLTGLIGNFIFRKESMGGGDVKLMAMIGAWIGWQPVLLAFFIAPFFGAVIGIILKIKRGQSLIPYGPFLSMATIISLLWAENIIDWLL